MTHTELGQRGAKRQSWRQTNPRALLESLHRKHPNASESELAEIFWDEIESNNEMLKVIALEYWFTNNYRSMTAVRLSHTAINRAKKYAAREIEDGIKKQAHIILLDLLMPNGKRLGDCTGNDCRQFSGWFRSIATKVKPRQKVSDVLSESQLRALFNVKP